MITDDGNLALIFNEYFVNIVPNLVSLIFTRIMIMYIMIILITSS